jgi:hypothetical protein
MNKNYKSKKTKNRGERNKGKMPTPNRVKATTATKIKQSEILL